MYCSRIQRLLSAYVDSELGGGEMLAVRSHLARCLECQQHHDRLVRMKRMLSVLPSHRPPAGCIERLLTLLCQQDPISQYGIGQILEEWRYNPRRPVWMASMAVGVALGLLLLFPDRSHEPVSRETAAALQDYLMRHAAYPAVPALTPGGPSDVLSSEARRHTVEVSFSR